MNELPKRKQIRLKEYDYNQNGYYFVTICTKDRKNIFYDNEEKPIASGMNENARIVKNAIEKIHEIYPCYSVDKYVIMPNHIHMIMVIDKTESGRPMTAPTTLSWVMNQFKGNVSKQIGYSCWQKSFYEHIIRNERDYQNIYEYIENNPAKWEEDEYYM